jgi:succinate-acetate transporter protein
MSNHHKSQWIIGNTFPFVVFGTFGAFWLTFGFTNVPFYNATGAFVTETYTTGAENPEFNASFGKLYVYPGYTRCKAD